MMNIHVMWTRLVHLLSELILALGFLSGTLMNSLARDERKVRARNLRAKHLLMYLWLRRGSALALIHSRRTNLLLDVALRVAVYGRNSTAAAVRGTVGAGAATEALTEDLAVGAGHDDRACHCLVEGHAETLE